MTNQCFRLFETIIRGETARPYPIDFKNNFLDTIIVYTIIVYTMQNEMTVRGNLIYVRIFIIINGGKTDIYIKNSVLR